MSHLLDDTQAARDMTNAMRSLLYAFHEDIVRRTCELPRVLDAREQRDIEIMVGEFMRRSGNYESRIDEIRQRAEAGLRYRHRRHPDLIRNPGFIDPRAQGRRRSRKGSAFLICALTEQSIVTRIWCIVDIKQA